MGSPHQSSQPLPWPLTTVVVPTKCVKRRLETHLRSKTLKPGVWAVICTVVDAGLQRHQHLPCQAPAQCKPVAPVNQLRCCTLLSLSVMTTAMVMGKTRLPSQPVASPSDGAAAAGFH